MKNYKITIVGLGYVGLPLARLFATKYSVIGFDINSERISELQSCFDSTLEVDNEMLKSVLLKKKSDKIGLYCTDDIDDIRDSNIYIITVPTPVDKNKRPILKPLIKASEMIGKVLKKDNIVVYESTVYPGATEEDCVPILEKFSQLKFNIDFFVGYSPERINPGDKEHTVEKIVKVVSGSNPVAANNINKVYKSVIKAGTHLAPTIRVAEAAKVIENTQRDINIAFINELAKIFGLMGINTHDVLNAASTKWNFLNFKPGLVGGHCIGVDPYYLAQKAQEYGYNPELILAGRRMNDSMGEYVASEVVKCMIKSKIPVSGSNILILGITFKEDCPDVRNTKTVDVINSLYEYGAKIEIYDPWANEEEVLEEYDLISSKIIPEKKYDAIVLTVSHKEFDSINITSLRNKNSIVYDVKNSLNKNIKTKTL